VSTEVTCCGRRGGGSGPIVGRPGWIGSPWRLWRRCMGWSGCSPNSSATSGKAGTVPRPPGAWISRNHQAAGGRLAFRRRRHSAAPSSDLLGFVVVTHPFHPLTGQRLEVLFAKRRDDGVVFVCSGGFSGQITLPEGW